MPIDVDPNAASGNLSDLVRALMLLVGVVAFSLVMAVVVLLLARWKATRPARRRRAPARVDPWVESGRRVGRIAEGDAP